MGLNSPYIQYQLRKFIEKFIHDIICLLETHVKMENQLRILQLIKPGWKCFANYSLAELGRIWMLHGSGVYLSVLKSSSQAIHRHVFSYVLQK